jgi:hypothetical protein
VCRNEGSAVLVSDIAPARCRLIARHRADAMRLGISIPPRVRPRATRAMRATPRADRGALHDPAPGCRLDVAPRGARDRLVLERYAVAHVFGGYDHLAYRSHLTGDHRGPLVCSGPGRTAGVRQRQRCRAAWLGGRARGCLRDVVPAASRGLTPPDVHTYSPCGRAVWPRHAFRQYALITAIAR